MLIRDILTFYFTITSSILNRTFELYYLWLSQNHPLLMSNFFILRAFDESSPLLKMIFEDLVLILVARLALLL